MTGVGEITIPYPPPSPPCVKLYKKLSSSFANVGSTLSLKVTGSRLNNAFIAYYKCEAKGLGCGVEVKEHEGCYRSVMGMGTFGGRNDCEKELRRMKECVDGGRKGKSKEG
ncbi:hypothetical protein TrCOL_g13068 [Triparma columacea]|uniref:Uncharacterized protein n=1 Tax=Triparma columacea TaxID=722753 RepID=A0A9W7L4M3_9STRA|nr:hypothetical protein TrCOL_g13068 [Triparma columacea]